MTSMRPSGVQESKRREVLEKFYRIGARAQVRSPQPQARWASGPSLAVTLDIATDREGRFFDIRCRSDCQLVILDTRPDVQHLLIMARTPES